MEKGVTLKNIESLISAMGASIKSDLIIRIDDVATSIDDLARITAKGFNDVRNELRRDFQTGLSGLDAKLTARIDALDARLDYRFDSLTNRIDGLALNKTSREEHRMLAARVTDIEERLI